MEPAHAIAMTVDSQSVDTSAGFVDLSESDLDALLDRIEQAKTHNLALSAGDYELLFSAVMMLANMQERLEKNDLSVHKLRKLLGMVRSSEKLRDLVPQADDSSSSVAGSEKSNKGRGKKRNRSKPRKKPAAKPQIHNHTLEGVSKGDHCPGCSAGKLYKYTPAVLLRVTGNAPLSCHKHLAEQMRCLCRSLHRHLYVTCRTMSRSLIIKALLWRTQISNST